MERNSEGYERGMAGGDYVVIKALENGVTVTGVTRGAENRFLHTEKLDEGEIWIAQFTEHVSAMKIRGAADVYTKHGVFTSKKKSGQVEKQGGNRKEKYEKDEPDINTDQY